MAKKDQKPTNEKKQTTNPSDQLKRRRPLSKRMVAVTT